MSNGFVLAGLDWDIAIRGILTVITGTVVLIGSIYLILGTNVGARLGFSVSMAGLFGFLSILTLVWWIQPPGIGPAGPGPSWKLEEIYQYYPGEAPPDPANPVLLSLPLPDALPAPEVVAEAAGGNLADELPARATLGDIAGTEFIADDGTETLGNEVLVDVFDLTKDGALNGWKLLATADAGEAQAAADAALEEQGYFGDATEYVRLDAFTTGGRPTLEDDCPDAVGEGEDMLVPTDWPCRAWSRVIKTFRLVGDPEYAVVQVRGVVPQETPLGEPAPRPVIDEQAPIVSVLLIRDEGNLRGKPAAWFVICASIFVFYLLLLHFRDKKAWENREQAPVKAGS